MNDAQTWTAILGVLTTLTGTMIFLARGIDSRFDRLETRFDRLEAKWESWVSRIEIRIDGLDRDVTALTRRQLGDQ